MNYSFCFLKFSVYYFRSKCYVIDLNPVHKNLDELLQGIVVYIIVKNLADNCLFSQPV